MKRLGMLGLSILMLLAIAAPASAAHAPRVPTGTYVTLFLGDTSVPESTAFHLRGGFFELRGVREWGRYKATLEMDGANVRPTIKTKSHDATTQTKVSYFEFPNGLTGTHNFVMRYWIPCGVDVAFPCGSLRRYTPVEAAVFPATITFVP